MKKYTSVFLVMMIVIFILSGCKNKEVINEDAQAFLEETEGISSDEATTGPRADRPPLSEPFVGQVPMEEMPFEEIPIDEVPIEAFPEEELPHIRVGIPSGLPALSMLGAMYRSAEKDLKNMEYDILDLEELMLPKLDIQAYDLVLLPTNIAAQAYNEGLDYKLVGTLLWGSQYIVANEEIRSWSSLKDKTILSASEGQASDAVVRYVLKSKGLEPDTDLEITYVENGADIAPRFLRGKAEIAVVAEPVLSSVLNRSESASVALDIQKAWSELTGSVYGYPQVSVMVSTELIESKPGAVKKLMRILEQSAEWINDEPDNAALYADSLEIGLKRKQILDAAERANIHFIPAPEIKRDIENYLSILMEYSNKLVGGMLPGDDFYLLPPGR